jgi:hypothetical protein
LPGRNPEKIEPVHQYQSISDDENDEPFGSPLGKYRKHFRTQ